VLGLFLVAWVMASGVQVWKPSVWGAPAPDAPAGLYGTFGALFTWLGFYVPLQLNKVSWEGRPWKLFWLNAGHDFFNLWIIANILSYWHP
jgi:hypothetical protein